MVVNGRRWRRSDPAIPTKLHSELVHELMDARRAVLASQKAKCVRAQKAARARVQDAKVALGERGEPYWAASEAGRRKRAAATIRVLLAHRARAAAARGAGASEPTICPSDVARTIGGDDWRRHMQLVREVASDLVSHGELRVLQRGREVSIEHARGPIRLARAPAE